MEEGAKGIMSHDEDILTLNVDGEALEEEMGCEREDETVQDAERVSTISNPALPSKKEREKHEATHPQYRSWCIACVRGRGITMKHHWALVSEKYGPTKGCPGCQKVTWGTVPSYIVATHSDACRERMERLMMQDPV